MKQKIKCRKCNKKLFTLTVNEKGNLVISCHNCGEIYLKLTATHTDGDSGSNPEEAKAS
jgi:phage FluMu protein Com